MRDIDSPLHKPPEIFSIGMPTRISSPDVEVGFMSDEMDVV